MSCFAKEEWGLLDDPEALQTEQLPGLEVPAGTDWDILRGKKELRVGSMHKHIAALPAVAVLSLSVLTLSVLYAATSNRQVDVVQTSLGELHLMPLYHGSVMLEFGGKVIHVDPWSQGDYTDVPQADLILVTHTHAEPSMNLTAMIEKVREKPATIIVGASRGHRYPQLCTNLRPGGDRQ